MFETAGVEQQFVIGIEELAAEDASILIDANQVVLIGLLDLAVDLAIQLIGAQDPAGEVLAGVEAGVGTIDPVIARLERQPVGGTIASDCGQAAEQQKTGGR